MAAVAEEKPKVEEVAAEEKPKIEVAAEDEVEDVDVSDDDDKGADGEDSKQSRSEKKARKAFLKLGLKPYPGVWRIALKKNKDVCFSISNPDVYVMPGTNTYIAFGDARVEDATTRAAQAVEQFKSKDSAAAPAGATTTAAAAPAAATAAEEENVDTTGVEEKDIDLVIQQTGVSRGKAVTVLKKHKNDIVNAIMELTEM